jgi:hypothetical protein
MAPLINPGWWFLAHDDTTYKPAPNFEPDLGRLPGGPTLPPDTQLGWLQQPQMTSKWVC